MMQLVSDLLHSAVYLDETQTQDNNLSAVVLAAWCNSEVECTVDSTGKRALVLSVADNFALPGDGMLLVHWLGQGCHE